MTFGLPAKVASPTRSQTADARTSTVRRTRMKSLDVSPAKTKPLFSAEEMRSKTAAALPEVSRQTCKAFYSSVADGITTDPEGMQIPISDHIVHRGRAVFDTATIASGQVYCIDRHLARFERSTKQATIPLAFPISEIRNILLQVAAAAGKTNNCLLRYWATPGSGDFAIESYACQAPAFYAVAHAKPRRGINVQPTKANSLPLKPRLLAQAKTTNYLLNALVAEEANRCGAQVAIQVDSRGNVVEGAAQAIGFVFRRPEDGSVELVIPESESSLPSITAQRALELVIEHSICDHALRRVVSESEAYESAIEIIALGGSYATPITTWNGLAVGDGEIGSVAKQLCQAIERDMVHGPLNEFVPYGDFSGIDTHSLSSL